MKIGRFILETQEVAGRGGTQPVSRINNTNFHLQSERAKRESGVAVCLINSKTVSGLRVLILGGHLQCSGEFCLTEPKRKALKLVD